LDIPIHREVFADNAVDQAKGRVLRVPERVWLRVARIGLRRLRLPGGRVGRGLRQDPLDIDPLFPVAPEPGVHLLLAFGALVLGRPGHPPIEDVREGFGWCLLRHGQYRYW
jgi:hypothetical protein